MVRHRQRNESEFARPARRRRRGKFKYLAGFLLLSGVVLVAALPTLLVRRSVLLPLVDRFAGLAPLRIDLESVKAGWFRPLELQGLQVLDGQGRLLAKVGHIQTAKGLWSWLRSSTAVGHIRISRIESAIAASGGTTNIEQALQPILDQYAAQEPTPDDASQTVTGTIEIVDSKFLLMEPGRPEQWVMAIPKLTVNLPTGGQVIGPIELQATVADVSGTVADSLGSIAANVAHSPDNRAFELRAKLEHVPVDFWHVVRARLPELPIEELRGRVTAVLSGNLVDANRWSFDVQRVESRGLHIDAPTLVGENPAQLQFLSAAGRASLIDGLLRLESAELACDFAQARAAAQLAWPLEMPTASDPFLKGGTLEASGAVDLPKLAQAAQSLLPLRADTQLQAGQIRFTVAQQLSPQGQPSSRGELELTGLEALAAGQEIRWQDPLKVELAAQRAAGGLQVAGRAVAEFCDVQASGTIEQGSVAGHVELDVLQQRLSQYVELPIRTMTGTADLSLGWQRHGERQVQATGTLTTTPLVIAAHSGGELQEPAWNGEFSATLSLANGAPERIERGQLVLKSTDEQLSVDLQAPLSLVAATGQQTPAAAAPFSFNLVGDLANWKRRGTMWLSEPPQLSLAGNVSLAVRGQIDMEHVEVLEANWRMQPLDVVTPQISLAEPQMVGNFKGRVDSNDLTRLVVEKLEVQSTSFSLGARDAAASDGSHSRVGQAMFLVDLDRITKNVRGQPAASASPPGAVLPPGASPEQVASYAASGRLQGQLAWQVSPQAATFELRADGEQVALLSTPASGPAVNLWEEPRLASVIRGNWQAATGAVNLESTQIQLPWMNYTGSLAYHPQGERQSVVMKGQAVYDSLALTARLAPVVGQQVKLVGQQTVPIDVTWTSSEDPHASLLAGLHAATRIGWEQARVAGIELGKADVPVRIDAGMLSTQAEFPVSGGVLRWDVTSDLTAPELVIQQKPMTVLENVEITPEMCQSWLKYVAPLVAEATSIDGRLSLKLSEARLTPADPKRQTVAGQLIMHNVTVGPGPLSNQVISLVKQVDAIRKRDFTQAVSSTQQVWMNMPEQQIDFQMADGRVVHRNLSVHVGDAQISTAGSVSVDGQLDLLATMPIPDDWIEKSPLLAGLRGQALNFPVRGSITQPQVDTQGLQQFGRQAVQSAATGLLQQQLSKGLGKLFGTPPIAAPPATTPPANPQ